MRWSCLVTEAWRNVASGAALAGPLAGVLAVLVAGLVAVGSADVQALLARADRFREAGAATLILRAPGAVDGVACEALNGTPGIRSGAVRAAPVNLVSAALPDSSVPTYEVTSSTPGLLAVDAGTEGVLLSREAADALGGTLAMPSGEVAVGGIYEFPDDGRGSDLAFAIVVPTTPTGPFDECWAETWPPSPALEPLLRTAFAPPTPSSDVTILQLNGTLGSTFDGAQLFRERLTRWVPVVAGVAAFLLTFGATRLRRAEFASGRHAGVALVDHLVIAVLESAVWIGLVGAAVVPVVCAFMLRSASGDAASFVRVGLATTALAVVAGLAGSVVAVLLSGEKHLFRLVKGRR